jgi:hypothetical protein
VCATVTLAIVLGAEERDLQAFENTPACIAGQSVGCQVEMPVTIEDRGQPGSSTNFVYYLDVSGAALADGRIELLGQSALWKAASAGDSATAIVWNGAVVHIEDNGVDGDTSQAFGVRIAQSRHGGGDGWTRILVPLNRCANPHVGRGPKADLRTYELGRGSAVNIRFSPTRQGPRRRRGEPGRATRARHAPPKAPGV